MNRKLGVYASVAIVLIMGAVAAWAWPQIPADKPLAVHWSATGAPNAYASKFWALLGLPLLAAAVAAILALVPLVEPRARNLAMSAKAYVIVWIGGLAVLATAYVALVLNATGHPVRIKVVLPITVGALFVVIGNYLGKTRSNFFLWRPDAMDLIQRAFVGQDPSAGWPSVRGLRLRDHAGGRGRPRPHDSRGHRCGDCVHGRVFGFVFIPRVANRSR